MISASSSQSVVQLNISDKFSQLLLNAKDSLTETAGKVVNSTTQTTSKVVETFTVTADRAKVSLSQTASKVVDTVTQAKDSFAQTTVNTVDTVNTTTDQAINTITETALQAGDSLKASTDRLSYAASTTVENAISTFINRQLDAVKVWIDAHPTISWITKALLWGMNHPIISLVIIVLVIFIAWQLFKAVGGFLEKGFLFILLAPFKLVYFFFKALFVTFTNSGNKTNIKQDEGNSLALKIVPHAPISLAQQERLATIMTRLEAISQEQNDLLQEVRALLTSEHPSHSALETLNHTNQVEKN